MSAQPTGYWRERWRIFLRQPIPRTALVLMGLLFGLSLCAELIANDRPLLVNYQGEYYFPLLFDYPESSFGGDFAIYADYKDPYIALSLIHI